MFSPATYYTRLFGVGFKEVRLVGVRFLYGSVLALAGARRCEDARTIARFTRACPDMSRRTDCSSFLGGYHGRLSSPGIR